MIVLDYDFLEIRLQKAYGTSLFDSGFMRARGLGDMADALEMSWSVVNHVEQCVMIAVVRWMCGLMVVFPTQRSGNWLLAAFGNGVPAPHSYARSILAHVWRVAGSGYNGAVPNRGGGV